MSHTHSKLMPMIVGSIGIVYGDIGTSPLYALKACFLAQSVPVIPENILGIVSLLFWSLVIVVSLKYIALILRANNDGEGGILTLTTLCMRYCKGNTHRLMIALGILGTALFYGDGVVTPAISILSALEGLSLISPHVTTYVVDLTIVVLCCLFAIQKNGSRRIGQLFGPIMIVWFITLALLGLMQTIQAPSILLAINPMHGIAFIKKYQWLGFATFGSIALVITGAEALYADLGHFNKSSIRTSWLGIVFPALFFNYMGQGALLLQNPAAIANPFYLMAPSWALYPLILLATFATIIASQSIISGIFSISWQAIQLGYFPRMKVIHTSAQQIGRVYVPFMNYLLLGLTVLTVILFPSSEYLASAYGITVTTIMLITTLLASFYAYHQWQWSRTTITLIFFPLILLDITFLAANAEKLFEGGWLPISITLAVYIIIRTWQNGQAFLMRINRSSHIHIHDYIASILHKGQPRILGVAIFISPFPEQPPSALMMHLEHNKFLHEKVVILSIITLDTPRVPSRDRIRVTQLAPHIYQVIAYYGYIGVPDVDAIFHKSKDYGLDIDVAEASFFLR